MIKYNSKEQVFIKDTMNDLVTTDVTDRDNLLDVNDLVEGNYS